MLHLINYKTSSTPAEFYLHINSHLLQKKTVIYMLHLINLLVQQNENVCNMLFFYLQTKDQKTPKMTSPSTCGHENKSKQFWRCDRSKRWPKTQTTVKICHRQCFILLGQRSQVQIRHLPMQKISGQTEKPTSEAKRSSKNK